jgi:hypothetical protein
LTSCADLPMYRNLQRDVKMSINYDSLFSFKSKLRLWRQSPVDLAQVEHKKISVDNLVQWQYHEGSFRRCFFLSRHALIDKLILTARWTVTLLCCPCRTQKSTRRCDILWMKCLWHFSYFYTTWSIVIFFSLVCWQLFRINLQHYLIQKSATRL